MPPHCDTCGLTEDPEAHLAILTRAGNEDDAPHGEVYLCADCLLARRERTWKLHHAEGDQVQQALTSHPRQRGGHFAYLTQSGAVLHLVRLRDDWIDERRAEHNNGPSL
jgi:hypothetical protein